MLREVDTWVYGWGGCRTPLGENGVGKPATYGQWSVSASSDFSQSRSLIETCSPHPPELGLASPAPTSAPAPYKKSRGVLEGLGGCAGCLSSPWVTPLTVLPGKMQEEPDDNGFLHIDGQKGVQAHTGATIS